MLWSQYFIPTVKESPADAVAASHVLAIRAGLVRQVAAGSYTYLPLGYRCLRKIEEIIREEMNAAGAIELHMPALQPLSLWEETGRAEAMGEVLMRIKGSGWQTGVVLGPTHEEVITETVRAYISSYKQLPINLYQIQTKFRGEERAKSGILRTREFLMKDAYSFDVDLAGLDASYRRMYDAYCRIFKRCGLPYLAVEAESGPIGGDASHEFMVLTDAGEDFVAISEDGSYAANIERAARAVPPLPGDPAPGDMKSLETVHTPGCPGIEDVCRFLGVQSSQMIKTLVYRFEPSSSEAKAGAGYVIICVRGDHDVNENKAKRLCPGGTLTMGEIARAEQDGFAIGYVGPHVVNQKDCTLIIDPDARALVNAVTGANKKDHHVTGFNWVRDVAAEKLSAAIVADVRNVVEGDIAPNGSGSRMLFRKAIEVGHVFKLGTKYSASMGATFLDENGKAREFIMGCYGIGVNRIMAAAIEAHHDADGICWPMSIAPFEVLIVALDTREEGVMSAARRIHDRLAEEGMDVLLDDRDARPGFKFKDADLIGIPIRVTVGKKGLTEGVVEVKMRDSKEMVKLTPEAAVAEVMNWVKEAKVL
ncbi:MAG TPA: proline--tRNA ligase [Phycisphaerae bacterium]|nr:proline--tRNA ligase [Phycisphaerae bacterium]